MSTLREATRYWFRLCRAMISDWCRKHEGFLRPWPWLMCNTWLGLIRLILGLTSLQTYNKKYQVYLKRPSVSYKAQRDHIQKKFIKHQILFTNTKYCT